MYSVMRYQSLSEILTAYRKGELSPEDCLIVDNDEVVFYLIDEDIRVSSCLSLLEEALTLLQIPWRSVCISSYY